MYVRLCDSDIPGEKKLVKLFANSENTNQTSHNAASDQGPHRLTTTLLAVS